MRIGAPAIIPQRFHSGDPDGKFRQALAPGTAEAVGDDDRNGSSSFLFHLTMNLPCRAIGIFGQQESVPASINIGNVDSAIGAEKAVASLSDEDAMVTADEGAAFAKSEFDDAGIEIVLPGPILGFRRGGNAGEIDELTFGLGDDLVLDYENVSGLDLLPALPQGFEQFMRDRVASVNFLINDDWKEANLE